MDDQDICQGCGQKNRCEQVYKALGCVKGPSVVSKVVMAFLLPLLVFIIALSVSQKIIAEYLDAQHWQTIISFTIAMLVTGICVVSIKFVRFRRHRNQLSRSC
jgi:uncharacterized integral membrane protein